MVDVSRHEMGFRLSYFTEMKWGWMVISLIFGILAQQVRAWRWRMSLLPLGVDCRRRVCEDAIFLSYASSLVIPRVEKWRVAAH